jgi:hypothetical protein
MDGHYISSMHCPFDGWSSRELAELAKVVEKLEMQGTAPSIASLRSEGVSESALKLVIVVEFGSKGSAFDAISPSHYIIDGKDVPLHKTGPDFH